MGKAIFISVFTIYILVSLVMSMFFFFLRSTEAGSPTKIDLEYFKLYEIGASHTSGQDRTGGILKCDLGAGDLDANCLVGTPCTCDAQVQVGYYYRAEFHVANDGATADGHWGYYSSIEELNGTVDTANDIWVVDGGAAETCTASTWSAGQLTWLETDTGCTLDLGGVEAGQMMFIIQIGSGAANTSGGWLHGEEDTDGHFLEAGVNITVASNISITRTTDGIINYGSVDINGGSTSTLPTAIDDVQTFQNNGGVAEKFSIKTSNATSSGGVTWTVGSSPGTNIYTHSFATTTSGYWQVLDTVDTYEVASSSIAVNGTLDFYMKIETPTVTDDYEQKNIYITVFAEQG